MAAIGASFRIVVRIHRSEINVGWDKRWVIVTPGSYSTALDRMDGGIGIRCSHGIILGDTFQFPSSGLTIRWYISRLKGIQIVQEGRQTEAPVAGKVGEVR